jgi:hypothetical protein
MIDQAFILCAGKATRLYPLTLDRPKCLLSIGETCILDSICSWLKKYGVQKYICNAFWKKDLIKAYAEKSDYNIVVKEESEILGTCGGVVNCLDLLDDDFIIVYGDMVIDIDLNRILNTYYEKTPDMLIVSRRTDEPWQCGVIYADENNKILKIVEKPDKESVDTDLINGGVLICNKRIFKNGFFDISKDLIPYLLENNYNVYHEEILNNEVLIDMGTFKNYELAKEIYDHNKNTDENILHRRGI